MIMNCFKTLHKKHSCIFAFLQNISVARIYQKQKQKIKFHQFCEVSFKLASNILLYFFLLFAKLQPCFVLQCGRKCVKRGMTEKVRQVQCVNSNGTAIRHDYCIGKTKPKQ